MLHLHFSNRLEDLLDVTADDLAERPRGVFTVQTIVVPSQSMGQWLQLGLADRHSIAAMMQTPLPGSFLAALYRRLLPVPDLHPAFERGALTFRVFEILQDGRGVAANPSLARYLSAAPEPLDRFHLAKRLAACYDQALIYRPDRLLAWEAGEESSWQAELWRELAISNGMHRARAFQRLDQAIAEAPRECLPDHLILFGFHTLPPVWLSLFAGLAARIPVQWLVPTPCREYWAGLDTPAALARRAARGQSVALRMVGHPLLATFGRQGAEFIDLLSELPGQVSEYFEDPVVQGRTDLLARMQSDLLNLRDPAESSPQPVEPTDDSIQVHCCAGALREVEVLHDRLRDLLDRQPDLNPSDIVVMTPDIERYAPYVDAVFRSRKGDLAIPYRVADRSLLRSEPVVAGFFAWLALPERRFTVNAVFDLLECPPVARRLGMSLGDRELLREWARRAAIHWGLDGSDKGDFELPPANTHTWRRGLDRLMLGTVLPEDGMAIHGDMAPVEAVDGAFWPVLGRLAEWIDALRADHDGLAEARSAQDWAEVLTTVLERLFEVEANEESALQQLRGAIRQIGADAAAAACTAQIPLTVFRAALSERLSASGSASGFLAGGVQFCAMVPLRSLPFSVVCLLGLDHDALPRRAQPEEFDPFASARRPGDRNAREDDAYLFLEAIISARRVLYLSYNGRDPQDYSERPPSVLLEQFVDTVTVGYYREAPGDWRERAVLVHPLQAFSRRQFEPDSPCFSYRRDLAEALAGASMPHPVIERIADLSDAFDGVIDFAELLRFWRHPVRYLLRQRLDIDLGLAQDVLADQEPFEPDGLERWQIRTQILAWLRQGMPPRAVLAHLRAADRISAGPWGTLIADQHRDEVLAIHQRFEACGGAQPPRSMSIDLPLGDMRLVGQLNDLTPDGLLRIESGPWKPRHTVEAWLSHLVLNLVAPEGVERRTIGLGQGSELDCLPISDAAEALQPWLAHYRMGLTQAPLPLLPEVLLAAKPSDPFEKRLQTRQKAFRECVVPPPQTGRPPDGYLGWLYGEAQPIDRYWCTEAEVLVAPIPQIRKVPT
ncbi:MAG: exodeoxyribonuclease V subunit gamma [Pseudomonadota bacterium]|nr:exodeoxyribonuclease V subunit gamma [Pseudomonadota bacterium]